MKIKVTQEDIDQGVPANCNKCPVALAVARALACSTDEIEVGSLEVIVVGLGVAFPTSIAAANFVAAFDAASYYYPCSPDHVALYGEVAPFEFEVGPCR